MDFTTPKFKGLRILILSEESDFDVRAATKAYPGVSAEGTSAIGAMSRSVGLKEYDLVIMSAYSDFDLQKEIERRFAEFWTDATQKNVRGVPDVCIMNRLTIDGRAVVEMPRRVRELGDGSGVSRVHSVDVKRDIEEILTQRLAALAVS